MSIFNYLIEKDYDNIGTVLILTAVADTYYVTGGDLKKVPLNAYVNKKYTFSDIQKEFIKENHFIMIPFFKSYKMQFTAEQPTSIIKKELFKLNKFKEFLEYCDVDMTSIYNNMSLYTNTLMNIKEIEIKQQYDLLMGQRTLFNGI